MMKDSGESLIKYLLDDFNDPDHKEQSLIDIYLNDQDYFGEMLKQKKVFSKAAAFCALYDAELKKTAATEPYEARQKKQEEYIRDFLCIEGIDYLTWEMFHPHAGSSEEDEKKLLIEQARKSIKDREIFCPYDQYPLAVRKYTTIRVRKSIRIGTPVMQCSKCGKYFIYTDYYPDRKELQLDNGSACTNLNPYAANLTVKKKSAHGEDSRIACYFYIRMPDIYEAPETCWNPGCGKARLIKKVERIGGHSYQMLECKRCGTYYVLQGLYQKHPGFFRCLQEDPVLVQRHEQEEIAERNRQKRMQNPESSTEKRVIKSVDLIVKSSTFRCVRKGHDVKYISAVIPLIAGNGTIYYRTVPAGYCLNCNTYFIRESTFDSIKRQGVIACRVQEETAYYHGSRNGYHELAQQSILMEYGYNVSSTRNLSPETRHRILTLIMDNHILSASGIINYLEFFISQRAGQKKNYDDAISKWREDIAFVRKHAGAEGAVRARSIRHKSYYKH